MAKQKDEREIRCSFCGKTQNQAVKIVAGPGVNICEKCVELCIELLNTDDIELLDLEERKNEIPSPKQIKTVLDQYVIGQEQAKKTLCVAVYNHYKRIKYNKKIKDVEIQKSNILMLGPTGCGKTLLAQTLAKILNVPFAIADATTLTEAGYVGEDVENILLRLIQAADYDIKRAEQGIIYIDEIDKISRKSENPSITRDVSGEGVQQALLKIIEGTVAAVPPQGGRKHPQQEFIHIDTSNILFICGGAFEGIDKIINARLDTKAMGFGSDVKPKNKIDLTRCFKKMVPQDLLKFGIIPELVGRLPVITALEQLDEKALVQILTKPKNSLIKQYSKLFEIDGIKLEFENEAIDAIVKKAVERNTGARGLRSIFEENMRDIMFELPSMKNVEKCIITADCINNNAKPIIVYENELKLEKEA